MTGFDARASPDAERGAEPITVLHVSADEAARERVAGALAGDLVAVAGVDEALEALQGVDCLVADTQLADGGVVDLLEAVRESAPLVPCVCFTATGSEALASAAIAAGAVAYLLDDGDGAVDALEAAIEDAVAASRAEEERRLLAAVPEASCDVTVVCDSDGRISYANPATTTLLGYRSDALRGRRLTELSHPADERSLRTAFERLASETETVGGHTWRCRSADGAFVRLDSRFATQFDERGDERVVLTARDVTHRADLETELARTMDRMSDGYLAVDDEWRVLDLNGHAEALCGVSRDEARGRSLWAVFPDTADSAVQQACESAVERDEPVAFTEWFDRRDAWFEVHAFPDEGGMSIYVADVTEAQSLRQRVERDRNLLAGVFETSPIAIVIIDDTGQITAANSRAETHLGLERSEITARTYDQPDWRQIDGNGDPLPPESLPVARALASGEPVFDAEHGIVLEDGRRRWLSVSAVPFTTVSEHGTDPVEHVVAAFADVTERREREEALSAANEQLEILNRILRHDIRNDISLISGWAQLLKKRTDLDEATLDRILVTTRSVIELTETTRQVLDIVTDGTDASADAVALAPVLEAEVTKQAAMHDSATVTLEPVDADVHVVATELLGTVFRNVISNAISHNPDESPTVDIRVTTDAESVTVAIADDGPGIPEAIGATVFEKTVTGIESQGTGIGLYLVTALMDLFGGTARIAETSAAGTTIELTFVRADED